MALAVCAVVGAALALFGPSAGGSAAYPGLDNAIVTVASYLAAYVAVTVLAFTLASPADVRAWSQRHGHGTWVQRYLLGTSPGPGVSIFVSALALAVGVYWMPRGDELGSTMPDELRIAVGLAVILVAWVCVVVSFTVGYYADDLLEGGGLDFPGKGPVGAVDYVYFALSVSTTFGTTDVDVTSPRMRRTVSVHGMIAFIFNTVILAAVVGVLAA